MGKDVQQEQIVVIATLVNIHPLAAILPVPARQAAALEGEEAVVVEVVAHFMSAIWIGNAQNGLNVKMDGKQKPAHLSRSLNTLQQKNALP
mgnify:CR=1 FL=1